MVVRLKLFVENANAVPELWVSYVLKAVESLLVGIEGSIDIILKEITMADSCPAWPILRVYLDHLIVVGDCGCVVTFCPIELGHLRVILEIYDSRVLSEV
jgi:hypothetical protein